jgi:hypothetical protein
MWATAFGATMSSLSVWGKGLLTEPEAAAHFLRPGLLFMPPQLSFSFRSEAPLAGCLARLKDDTASSFRLAILRK